MACSKCRLLSLQTARQQSIALSASPSRRRCPQLESSFRSALNYSRNASTTNLPRVAQPSLWETFIPKALRNRFVNREADQGTVEARRKEWNPATPFIILGLLAGSMGIHIINLQRSMTAYSRMANQKINKLQRVIHGTQKGKLGQFSPEHELGTGDPQQEAEWKEGRWFHFL